MRKWLLIVVLMGGAPMALAVKNNQSDFDATRDVVMKNVARLGALRLEAPDMIVADRPFEVRIRAEVPPEVALPVKPPDIGRLHIVGDWPDYVQLKGESTDKTAPNDPPAALGINTANCPFGVIERDKKYFVEWIYSGIARETGSYKFHAEIRGLSSSNLATVRIANDTLMEMVDRGADALTAARFPIITILLLFLLTASESTILILSALTLMLYRTFNEHWSVLVECGIISVVLLLHNTIYKKSVLQHLAEWHKLQPKPPDGIKDPVEKHHDRSEEMMTRALQRARLQFACGAALALSAIISLLIPVTEPYTSAPDHTEPAAVSQIIAAAPRLLIFIGLILGTRFFLRQHRISLDDHRHFEDVLRDREWQRLILEAEEPRAKRMGKLKDLLVVREKKSGPATGEEKSKAEPNSG